MPHTPVTVRPLTEADLGGVIALCERTYPSSPPWTDRQLMSHLELFPEGQIVATDEEGVVRGYAASLIIKWDEYAVEASWRELTASGMFTNHDPVNGRTLYGAEIMVDPLARGSGIGGRLYTARRRLTRQLRLLRIRAGARLRGYHRHAATLPADEYAARVVQGELKDPTLSFQLRQGFQVFAVVPNYLSHDPESLGWAALIEWMNWRVADAEHQSPVDARFIRPSSR
jgi:GNAT superfamily N-acetyltransferase